MKSRRHRRGVIKTRRHGRYVNVDKEAQDIKDNEDKNTQVMEDSEDKEKS